LRAVANWSGGVVVFNQGVQSDSKQEVVMSCTPKVDIAVSKGSATITCVCEGDCDDASGCVPHWNVDAAQNQDIEVSDTGTAGNKAQIIIEATGGKIVPYKVEFHCSCGKHNSDSAEVTGHLKYVRPLWQDIVSFGITVLVDKVKH
jgi:hypothetical protein